MINARTSILSGRRQSTSCLQKRPNSSMRSLNVVNVALRDCSNRSNGDRNRRQHSSENNKLFTNEEGKEKFLPPLTLREKRSSATFFTTERRRYSSENETIDLKLTSSTVRRSSVDYLSVGKITKQNFHSTRSVRPHFSKLNKNTQNIFASASQSRVLTYRRKSTPCLQRPPNIMANKPIKVDPVSRTNLSLVNDVIAPTSSVVSSSSSPPNNKKRTRLRRNTKFRRASLPNSALSFHVYWNNTEYDKALPRVSNSTMENVGKDFMEASSISFAHQTSACSSLKKSQVCQKTEKLFHKENDEITNTESTISKLGSKNNHCDGEFNHQSNDKKRKDTKKDSSYFDRSPETKRKDDCRDIFNVVSSSFLEPNSSKKEHLCKCADENNETKTTDGRVSLQELDFYNSRKNSKEFELLFVESENEFGFIDDSVVYINDEDLCDDDWKEKRIIVWIRRASTGDEAEQRTIVTPPPSPDLRSIESAIRVVYDEGKTQMS